MIRASGGSSERRSWRNDRKFALSEGENVFPAAPAWPGYSQSLQSWRLVRGEKIGLRSSVHVNSVQVILYIESKDILGKFDPVLVSDSLGEVSDLHS